MLSKPPMPQQCGDETNSSRNSSEDVLHISSTSISHSYTAPGTPRVSKGTPATTNTQPSTPGGDSNKSTINSSTLSTPTPKKLPKNLLNFWTNASQNQSPNSSLDQSTSLNASGSSHTPSGGSLPGNAYNNNNKSNTSADSSDSKENSPKKNANHSSNSFVSANSQKSASSAPVFSTPGKIPSPTNRSYVSTPGSKPRKTVSIEGSESSNVPDLKEASDHSYTGSSRSTSPEDERVKPNTSQQSNDKDFQTPARSVIPRRSGSGSGSSRIKERLKMQYGGKGGESSCDEASQDVSHEALQEISTPTTKKESAENQPNVPTPTSAKRRNSTAELAALFNAQSSSVGSPNKSQEKDIGTPNSSARINKSFLNSKEENTVSTPNSSSRTNKSFGSTKDEKFLSTPDSSVRTGKSFSSEAKEKVPSTPSSSTRTNNSFPATEEIIVNTPGSSVKENKSFPSASEEIVVGTPEMSARTLKTLAIAVEEKETPNSSGRTRKSSTSALEEKVVGTTNSITKEEESDNITNTPSSTTKSTDGNAVANIPHGSAPSSPLKTPRRMSSASPLQKRAMKLLNEKKLTTPKIPSDPNRTPESVKPVTSDESNKTETTDTCVSKDASDEKSSESQNVLEDATYSQKNMSGDSHATEPSFGESDGHVAALDQRFAKASEKTDEDEGITMAAKGPASTPEAQRKVVLINRDVEMIDKEKFIKIPEGLRDENDVSDDQSSICVDPSSIQTKPGVATNRNQQHMHRTLEAPLPENFDDMNITSILSDDNSEHFIIENEGDATFDSFGNPHKTTSNHQEKEALVQRSTALRHNQVDNYHRFHHQEASHNVDPGQENDKLDEVFEPTIHDSDYYRDAKLTYSTPDEYETSPPPLNTSLENEKERQAVVAKIMAGDKFHGRGSRRTYVNASKESEESSGDGFNRSNETENMLHNVLHAAKDAVHDEPEIISRRRSGSPGHSEFSMSNSTYLRSNVGVDQPQVMTTPIAKNHNQVRRYQNDNFDGPTPRRNNVVPRNTLAEDDDEDESVQTELFEELSPRKKREAKQYKGKKQDNRNSRRRAKREEDEYSSDESSDYSSESERYRSNDGENFEEFFVNAILDLVSPEDETSVTSQESRDSNRRRRHRRKKQQHQKRRNPPKPIKEVEIEDDETTVDDNDPLVAMKAWFKKEATAAVMADPAIKISRKEPKEDHSDTVQNVEGMINDELKLAFGDGVSIWRGTAVEKSKTKIDQNEEIKVDNSLDEDISALTDAEKTAHVNGLFTSNTLDEFMKSIKSMWEKAQDTDGVCGSSKAASLEVTKPFELNTSHITVELNSMFPQLKKAMSMGMVSEPDKEKLFAGKEVGSHEEVEETEVEITLNEGSREPRVVADINKKLAAVFDAANEEVCAADIVRDLDALKATSILNSGTADDSLVLLLTKEIPTSLPGEENHNSKSNGSNEKGVVASPVSIRSTGYSETVQDRGTPVSAIEVEDKREVIGDYSSTGKWEEVGPSVFKEWKRKKRNSPRMLRKIGKMKFLKNRFSASGGQPGSEDIQSNAIATENGPCVIISQQPAAPEAPTRFISNGSSKSEETLQVIGLASSPVAAGTDPSLPEDFKPLVHSKRDLRSLPRSRRSFRRTATDENKPSAVKDNPESRADQMIFRCRSAAEAEALSDAEKETRLHDAGMKMVEENESDFVFHRTHSTPNTGDFVADDDDGFINTSGQWEDFSSPSSDFAFGSKNPFRKSPRSSPRQNGKEKLSSKSFQGSKRFEI